MHYHLNPRASRAAHKGGYFLIFSGLTLATLLPAIAQAQDAAPAITVAADARSASTGDGLNKTTAPSLSNPALIGMPNSLPLSNTAADEAPGLEKAATYALPLLTFDCVKACRQDSVSESMANQMAGYSRIYVQQVQDGAPANGEDDKNRYQSEEKTDMYRAFFGYNGSRIVKIDTSFDSPSLELPSKIIVSLSHTADGREGQSWTSQVENRLYLTPYFSLNGSSITLNASMKAAAKSKIETDNVIWLVQRAEELLSPQPKLITAFSREALKSAGSFVNTSLQDFFSQTIIETRKIQFSPLQIAERNIVDQQDVVLATVEAILPGDIRDTPRWNFKSQFGVGKWEIRMDKPIVSIFSSRPFCYYVTGCPSFEAQARFALEAVSSLEILNFPLDGKGSEAKTTLFAKIQAAPGFANELSALNGQPSKNDAALAVVTVTAATKTVEDLTDKSKAAESSVKTATENVEKANSKKTETQKTYEKALEDQQTSLASNITEEKKKELQKTVDAAKAANEASDKELDEIKKMLAAVKKRQAEVQGLLTSAKATLKDAQIDAKAVQLIADEEVKIADNKATQASSATKSASRPAKTGTEAADAAQTAAIARHAQALCTIIGNETYQQNFNRYDTAATIWAVSQSGLLNETARVALMNASNCDAAALAREIKPSATAKPPTK